MQARLFAEYGLASGQALPPVVPIGFVEDDFFSDTTGRGESKARALLERVEKSVRAPWRARAGALIWREGFLFLGIDSGAAWTQAREALRGAAPLAEPGLFPAAEGFFLGCGEANDVQRASIRLEVPRLSFSSATITLLRIASPAGAREFWREVYWESLGERPLRGRRGT
jgi:hypothetical protein